MLHYHGTPISPRSKLIEELMGRCFCVSYAEPRDLEICHEIGQSVLLDNGAYTFWRQGGIEPDWRGYYRWVQEWLEHRTTWAVIPDVIAGSEEDNDRLLIAWYQRRLPRGAPVWHMHESLERLRRLCHGYERVCIGSSAQYADPNSPRWERRMDETWNAIHDSGAWMHMLRAMTRVASGPWPFASADSSTLARCHAGNNTRNGAPKALRRMADEIDARQPPARWEPVVHQETLPAH
jgi:hypothetical protein